MLPLQLLRGVVGTLAMFCGFYAVAHMPLADAQSLNFARGLFLVPLAILFLKEVVGGRRIAAMVVGFLGVLIMLRPTGEIEPAALVALAGAALVAFATVLVKIVSRYDSPVTLMFYTGFVGTLVAVVPAILNWVPPTAFEYFLLVLVGSSGRPPITASFAAMRWGRQPLWRRSNIRRSFCGDGGLFIFADVPDIYTVVGALTIVGASLYIVRREAQAIKPRQPPVNLNPKRGWDLMPSLRSDQDRAGLGRGAPAQRGVA